MEDLDSRRWGIRLVEEMARCFGSGVSLVPANDGDVSHFLGTIPGPPGTIYEGQSLHLHINIPDDYPLSAPAMRFMTLIKHPSVKPDGSFGLKVFDTWTPRDEIKKVLVSLTSLLSSQCGKIFDSEGDLDIGDLDIDDLDIDFFMKMFHGTTDKDGSSPTRHNVSDSERVYMDYEMSSPVQEEVSAVDKIAQERLPDVNCETNPDNVSDSGGTRLEYDMNTPGQEVSALDKIAQERLPDANCETNPATIEGGSSPIRHNASDSCGTRLEYDMNTPGQDNSTHKTVGQEDTHHDPQDPHRPVKGISEKDNTPAKVFKALEDSLYNKVVTWQDNGQSFRVENQSLLEKKLLHVKNNRFNFKSFGALMRHLVDNYGFTSSKEGDGKWHFRHPNFKQQDPDAAVNMIKQNAAKVNNRITVKGLQVQINAVRMDFGRLEAKVDESAETQKSDSKKLDQLLEAVVGKPQRKQEGSPGTNEPGEK